MFPFFSTIQILGKVPEFVNEPADAAHIELRLACIGSRVNSDASTIALFSFIILDNVVLTSRLSPSILTAFNFDFPEFDPRRALCQLSLQCVSQNFHL